MASHAFTILESSPDLRGTTFFPPEFIGFDGHFPGLPLLPGFLHIQLAMDLLRAAGIPGTLHRVEAAKFTRPILPQEHVHLRLAPRAAGLYDVTLSVADELCSTFELFISTPSPTQE